MHATISWSYDALPPDVQSLFRQLSMFSGGWNLEAAEAVCEPTAVSVRRWVGDPARPPSRPTRRHRRRIPIRDVRDRPRVRPTRVGECRRRRQTWRDAMRRTSSRSRTSPSASSPGRSGGVAGSRRDRARQHSRRRCGGRSPRIPRSALDLAGTMWRFWVLRGYVKEGLGWLERSIDAASDSPSTVRARAMLGAGSMLRSHRGRRGGRAPVPRGLAGLGGDRRSRSGIALAYRHLGNADLGRGRYAQAIEWYVKARRLGEQLHDDGVIAGSVSNLGSVAYFQGDYERAEEHWTEAAAFFRGVERHQPPGVDPQQPGRAGGAARRSGRRRDAARGGAGAPPAVARPDRTRPDARQPRQGRPAAPATSPRARAVLEDGLARLRSLGIERDIGACLYNMALLARAEGRTAEAAQHGGREPGHQARVG